jgi:S-adenosylmethionine:tRNA ribosyltransferase-isomerase
VRTDRFDYDLPEERIARHPTQERDGARLMVLEGEGVHHATVRDWPALLAPGSLVVLNDTRVSPSRLLGKRLPHGGRVELLLLAPAEGAGVWRAIGQASKPLRPGTVVAVGGGALEIMSRGPEGQLLVRSQGRESIADLLAQQGQVPLPPYLRREPEPEDRVRYQTVYAEHEGSVAAPTAGLHLSLHVLEELEARGIELGRLTLHVGLGTFRPVTADEVDDHTMHEEWFAISPLLAEQVTRARREGRPVVAVGTTVVRALETVAQRTFGEVTAFTGTTRLFIKPGFNFRVTDALFTNFHTPRSTLLMLVCAFAGEARTLAAYAEAVRSGYRFFSYGDAMWLPRRQA